MKSRLFRIVIACVAALVLSSCGPMRKLESDFQKFEVSVRALLQGKKAPVEKKPDKVAPKRTYDPGIRQIDRGRQARIPTAVAQAPEKIEAPPVAAPKPARRAKFAVPIPRPAPQAARGTGVEIKPPQPEAVRGDGAGAPSYKGGRRRGVAHGEGEWRSPAGHRYIGAFRNGKFHGYGTYLWPDGERYEGDFRDGKFYGTGVWSMADGDRYAGEVRDGTFHGRGIYTRPDGERYEGDFRDGKFYGFGKWTMADGKRYVGDVRNDEFHGCGAYVWPNGEYYAGEFQRDRFHGLGSYAWPDGLMKTCEWREDAAVEGSCVEHRADGETPERAGAVCFRAAAWRSSLPAPAGEPAAAGGSGETTRGREERDTAGAAVAGDGEDAKYEGPHKDGKPHGQGVLTFANGDRYEGAFADGEIRGRGTMYLANGDVYGGDGEFDSRGYQGCGMYVRANGDRYMGQFRDGRFHGRGTYEWAQGVAATCDWRDGERVVESCKAHRVTGIGKRYTGDGICGTLTARNVKQHKRWGR